MRVPKTLLPVLPTRHRERRERLVLNRCRAVGRTGSQRGQRHTHPLQRSGERSGDDGQIWWHGAFQAARAAIAADTESPTSTL